MRASLFVSKLPRCSIRFFLLADVFSDLLQLEPDGGYGITAGPEMLAAKITLLPAQASDRNRALPFQKSDHRSNRVLRRNCDAHVHVVRHEMPFQNLALLSFCCDRHFVLVYRMAAGKPERPVAPLSVTKPVSVLIPRGFYSVLTLTSRPTWSSQTASKPSISAPRSTTPRSGKLVILGAVYCLVKIPHPVGGENEYLIDAASLFDAGETPYG